MPQDKPVDSAALASHFGVTVGTVNRWVREGRIPFIRPSRRVVRFHVHDVEQALQGGTNGAGEGSGTDCPEGEGAYRG